MARFEFSFSKYGESFSSFQIRKGPCIIGTGAFCFCFFLFFLFLGCGCTRRHDLLFEVVQICFAAKMGGWVVGWWWCRWRGAAEIELNA